MDEPGRTLPNLSDLERLSATLREPSFETQQTKANLSEPQRTLKCLRELWRAMDELGNAVQIFEIGLEVDGELLSTFEDR